MLGSVGVESAAACAEAFYIIVTERGGVGCVRVAAFAALIARIALIGAGGCLGCGYLIGVFTGSGACHLVKLHCISGFAGRALKAEGGKGGAVILQISVILLIILIVGCCVLHIPAIVGAAVLQCPVVRSGLRCRVERKVL